MTPRVTSAAELGSGVKSHHALHGKLICGHSIEADGDPMSIDPDPGSFIAATGSAAFFLS